MSSEYVNIKMQEIKNDLTLLRNKHIHELEKIPGTPKCSTLADRIENNVDYVVNEYKKLITEQRECASREQFDLLAGMLTRLASDISDLSKKQPDGLLNTLKVGQINRVLKPLKDIMSDEPAIEFLDLVSEVEDGAEISRNSYSDVAIILSQYREACGEYRSKHYDESWNMHL